MHKDAVMNMRFIPGKKDFMFAPKEFLIFAKRQWLRHVKEHFE
jgi:hypothetical protein